MQGPALPRNRGADGSPLFQPNHLPNPKKKRRLPSAPPLVRFELIECIRAGVARPPHLRRPRHSTVIRWQRNRTQMKRRDFIQHSLLGAASVAALQKRLYSATPSGYSESPIRRFANDTVTLGPDGLTPSRLAMGHRHQRLPRLVEPNPQTRRSGNHRALSVRIRQRPNVLGHRRRLR